MTTTLSDLHKLAARGMHRGVDIRIHAKFSEGDLADDLTRLIINVQPDLVILDADTIWPDTTSCRASCVNASNRLPIRTPSLCSPADPPPTHQQRCRLRRSSPWAKTLTLS